MKAGTKVKVLGVDWNGDETAESAKVLRWSRISGPRESVPGYHRVRFDADNGVLLVHESRLRAAA